jgi:nitronate monooxygenase
VNGFAFVRAVRNIYDGPVVLAGGISDGRAVFAAEALGCDFVYMGTKFIATKESRAADGYKEMLVNSTLDDILLSRAFTGLETNTLIPSIVAAGLDPHNLPADISEIQAQALYGRNGTTGVKRWKDTWSAGHSVFRCRGHSIRKQSRCSNLFGIRPGRQRNDGPLINRWKWPLCRATATAIAPES